MSPPQVRPKSHKDITEHLALKLAFYIREAPKTRMILVEQWKDFSEVLEKRVKEIIEITK